MDLSFREGLSERFEKWLAKVEVILREFEVEERCLPFLKLRGGRQYIVRLTRRFCHRNIDRDHQLHRTQCLTHTITVGQRMHGVRRLDKHGSVAIWVIGQNLIGNNITRNHAADNRCLHNRRLTRAAAASRNILQVSWNIMTAFLTEMPTQDPNQFFEVTDQR